MNTLKNLKIAHKILLFVGIAVLFICIVGYTGYYYIIKEADNIGHIYNDNLIPVRLNNENRAHLRANEANLLLLMTSHDKSFEQTVLKDFNRRAELFNQNVNEFKKTNLDTVEKSKLKEIEVLLAEYRVKRILIINLATHDKDQQAIKEFLSIKPLFNKLNGKLTELSNHSTNKAKLVSLQSKKDAETAVLIILSIIATAATLAIIIGLSIANLISKPVTMVVESLRKISEGDLTIKDIDFDYKDEIGLLASALNTTSANLRLLIGEVSRSVEEISANSEEMSASSEQTAMGSQQVATSVTQLATGAQEQANGVNASLQNINDMSKDIYQISENTKNVVKLAEFSEENANNGYKQAEVAVDKINQVKASSEQTEVTINKLGSLSKEIEVIVDLIKNIAGQTNLLALNAAIEAARAGEHGKGFAVVAEEVKKLAGQSAEATDKITSMIKEIQNETNTAINVMHNGSTIVEEGVEIVTKVGESLKEILNAANQVNEQAENVSTLVEKVATNSDNIVKSMENIAAITEESAASSEEISSITEEQSASLQEISSSSQNLAKVAESLNQQVSIFKT